MPVDDADREVELVDAVVEGVYEEIRATRDALDLDASELYFYTRVLAGKWTKIHKGVACDAIAAFCRAGLPLRWCKLFTWPPSKSYAFSLYGQECAMMCTHELCKRANFFFSLWLENDRLVNLDYVGLAEYVPDEDFVEWLSQQDIESIYFENGIWVHQLVPIARDIAP